MTLLAAAVAPLCGGDEPSAMLRDGFEASRPVWQQEQADTTVKLLAHERSDRAHHEGRLAERFLFEAGVGSAFYFSYALPPIPLTDDLRASLYVRSNRAGVQLFGRVILPADNDPKTKEPSYVLVPGTIYEASDRWRRLELIELRHSVEEQARVLRAATKRPVSLEGAYLDRLVVNLFGGEGETDVFLDELVVTPVPARLAAAHERAEKAGRASEEEGTRTRPDRPDRPSLQIVGNRLRRNGNGRLLTVIDASGADVRQLRDAGFDVLSTDLDADPQRVDTAIRRGLLLMPSLASVVAHSDPFDPQRVLAAVSAYPYRDAVAFWNLGEHLGRDRDSFNRSKELERTRALIVGLREQNGAFSKLSTAMVEGEFPLYAHSPKNLDLLGVRPNAWGSVQELMDTYHYLTQRRDLTVRSNADELFLGWVPATPPPALQEAIWGQDVPPSWGTPRVQPEQIRLITYAILAAGYRGVGFHASADLTRGLGRMLLIEMALLNAEIDLFESVLANNTAPIPLHFTFNPEPKTPPPVNALGKGRVQQKVLKKPEPGPHPSIRAASIGTVNRKGFLLLVADFPEAAQCQPPQMALNDLNIRIPAPEDAQAFVIDFGGVSVLDTPNRMRVPGGVQLVIPDFGPTALVLVTSDLALAGGVEAAIRGVRPMAVQLAIEQAKLELEWTREINGRLLDFGHPLRDPRRDPNDPDPAPALVRPPGAEESGLLAKAEEYLKLAREALEHEDYAQAWSEARRVGRPLRMLLRAHWQQGYEAMVEASTPANAKNSKASQKLIDSLKSAPNRNRVKNLDDLRLGAPVLMSFVSSPPLLAINTLPQHYIWVDWMKNARFGSNLVSSGDFESREALESAGWTDVGYPQEVLKTKIENVPGGRDGSKRLLRMTVEAADKTRQDQLPPYLDHPVAAIRSPAVPVRAGQFLRYSVLVQKSYQSVAGAGGIIIRDSIGGEPLQFRTSNPLGELTRLVFYRRVPTDSLFTVTLG
jgi:hypothetical protein